MKRQYRYKTAADTKDFFPRRWFDEFNNLVGELHDEMLKTFNNQSVLMKIKDRITGKPYDLLDYTDAYVFPNDACDKIMGLLSEYETWYTDEWTFLEKDSYDKLKEAINRCDFIKVNLKKFADKQGKEVTGQLDKIYKAIEQLRDACGAPGASLSTIGFDNSKNKEIQAFLNALTTSGVEEKLTEILTFLAEFISELGGASGYSGTMNPHYWTAAKEDDSEIIKRADEVKEELKQETKNKKEDAESERNKKKEEKRKEKLEYEPYDIDQVMSVVDPAAEKLRKLLKAICRKFHKIYSAYMTTLNALGIASGRAWKDTCDEFFDRKLTEYVNKWYDKKKIRTRLNSETLKNYLTKRKKEFDDFFDDTSITFINLEKNDSIKEYKLPKNSEIKTLKEVRDISNGIIKFMMDKLENHII